MLDGFGFVVLGGFVHYVTCCVGGLLYCLINLLECCYASVYCDCAVAWHVCYTCWLCSCLGTWSFAVVAGC